MRGKLCQLSKKGLVVLFTRGPRGMKGVREVSTLVVQILDVGSPVNILGGWREGRRKRRSR